MQSDTAAHATNGAEVATLDVLDPTFTLGSDAVRRAAAVEEVMRVSPAVPVVARVATETFAFQGLRIPAGTMLQLFTATANTDRPVFGAAEFDITQNRPAQLTFGGGIHYCLATRLRQPRLAGEVRWRPALGIYGPLPLPLRFTA
jgi:cytochrome P450